MLREWVWAPVLIFFGILLPGLTASPVESVPNPVVEQVK